MPDLMNAKWKRLRQSTHIEDRRKPVDLNRSVVSKATDPPPDPTVVSPDRARLDRFRSETSVHPLQQYMPNFGSALKRKRK